MLLICLPSISPVKRKNDALTGTKASTMRKEKITIKKYKNRRLYDLNAKQYITLDDLTGFIQEGHEVEIVDSATGDDITQSVLIQIILDNQKEDGYNLFSNELLHQLIQYRSQSTLDFFQRYLPSILEGYLDWQHQTKNQFMNWAQLGWNTNPFSRNMFTPGMGMWGTDPSHYNSSPSDADESPSSKASKTNESAPDQEVEALKKRIEEMEALLKKTPKKD